MQFQFRSAGQLIFGPGEHRKAVTYARDLGRRVLLVTGASSLAQGGLLAPLQAALAERAEHVEHIMVSGEPEVTHADALAQQCREAACDVVLAIGGGSVLDIGKAVAALSQNPGSAIEYLEDVGRGPPQPLRHAPLPVVAVPTTAGSGSEVTRNSVLKVPALRVKRSLRSDLLLPRVAIVDPDLLQTAPRRVAAAAGMDALTHLIEAYLSKGAQPITDVLCTRGIELLWPALHQLAAVHATESPTESPTGLASAPSTLHPHLALASLWGGIALANAGLGAVHGLVAPLGGQCGVAHGDGCACLLPATFAANARAIFAQAQPGPAAERLRLLIRLLTQAPKDRILPATADDDSAAVIDLDQAVERLSTLRQRLGILSLAEQGVSPDQLASIVAQSRGGSMRSNPVELSDEALFDILQQSLRLSPEQAPSPRS